MSNSIICKPEEALFWMNRGKYTYNKRLVSTTGLADGKVLMLFEDS